MGFINEPLERFNGSVYLLASTSVTNPDPADSQEYEYWNGSSWISDSFFNINTRPYVVGFQWRTRIVNSYFNSTGPWVTSPGAALEDTGGASSLGASFPAFTISSHGSPLASTGTTTFLVQATIDSTAYSAARNIYSVREVYVYVSWNQSGSPSQQEASFTFPLWPTMTPSWTYTSGSAQMNTVSVGGGNASIQFYVPATINGTFTSNVQTYIEFRAKYPDSDLNSSTYALRGQSF